MPVSVTMPALGESVTEGTVTRWLKREGERVEADEPLLEVSTDKVDTEIPSPAAGVVSKIVVPEDEVAAVGAELAVISTDGDGGQSGAGGDEAGADDAGTDDAGTDDAGSGDAGAGDAGTGVEPAGGRAADVDAAAAEASGGESPDGPAGDPAGDGAAPAAAASEDAPSPEQASAAMRDAARTTDAGTEVTLPALGESVTEGTVTRWLKSVGDTVAADEPLLEISTDKVDTEIPSPAAGTVLEIRVAEDETVEVGAVLAVIGGAGAAPAGGDAEPAPAEAAQQADAPERAEAPEQETEAPEQSRTQPEPQAAEPAAAPQSGAAAAAPTATRTDAAPARSQPTSGGDGAYLTPLVRKLAAEHRVDLSTVTGTGVGGRIRKNDVLEAAARQEQPAPAAQPEPAAQPAAAKAAAPSPLRGRTEKLPRMRALIARRMVESLQVSAQLTTVVEVDVTTIARLRQRAKEEFLGTHGVKLSFLPFFALAAVEALRVHPNLNASLDMEAGTVTYHGAEHLGMAVDTERGLVVPVIRDAGDLNLAGLARRIADVAERTRANKVSPDELSGGTFTLTNTGSRGALFDTPIINQPQVAILGTGAVVKRAAVVDDPRLGEIIVPRSMMYLALSYDHRLVDGADAARFLGTMKERLEAGNFEAELGLAQPS